MDKQRHVTDSIPDEVWDWQAPELLLTHSGFIHQPVGDVRRIDQSRLCIVYPLTLPAERLHQFLELHKPRR